MEEGRQFILLYEGLRKMSLGKVLEYRTPRENVVKHLGFEKGSEGRAGEGLQRRRRVPWPEHRQSLARMACLQIEGGRRVGGGGEQILPSMKAQDHVLGVREVVPVLLPCLELTDIMAQSRDYNELRNAWKEWRDVSGKKIRTQYKRYVSLSNKAARLNGKSCHALQRED